MVARARAELARARSGPWRHPRLARPRPSPRLAVGHADLRSVRLFEGFQVAVERHEGPRLCHHDAARWGAVRQGVEVAVVGIDGARPGHGAQIRQRLDSRPPADLGPVVGDLAVQQPFCWIVEKYADVYGLAARRMRDDLDRGERIVRRYGPPPLPGRPGAAASGPPRPAPVGAERMRGMRSAAPLLRSADAPPRAGQQSAGRAGPPAFPKSPPEPRRSPIPPGGRRGGGRIGAGLQGSARPCGDQRGPPSARPRPSAPNGCVPAAGPTAMRSLPQCPPPP